jgi:DNA-directed RNA polymerase subunit omega
MARITVEDCLQKVNNRFALIHMVSKRVRQLRKGDEPTISSKNKDIVISLREIAAGTIRGFRPTNPPPVQVDTEENNKLSEDAGDTDLIDNG